MHPLHEHRLPRSRGQLCRKNTCQSPMRWMAPSASCQLYSVTGDRSRGIGPSSRRSSSTHRALRSKQPRARRSLCRHGSVVRSTVHGLGSGPARELVERFGHGLTRSRPVDPAMVSCVQPSPHCRSSAPRRSRSASRKFARRRRGWPRRDRLGPGPSRRGAADHRDPMIPDARLRKTSIYLVEILVGNRPDRGSLQRRRRRGSTSALSEVRDAEEVSGTTIGDRGLARGRRLIEHPDSARAPQCKSAEPDRPGCRRSRPLGADFASQSAPASADRARPSRPRMSTEEASPQPRHPPAASEGDCGRCPTVCPVLGVDTRTFPARPRRSTLARARTARCVAEPGSGAVALWARLLHGRGEGCGFVLIPQGASQLHGIGSTAAAARSTRLAMSTRGRNAR